MPDAISPHDPIDIPPLTGIYAEPFSVGKLFMMMRFFGPAAVVASLSLGVGETIMVTGLGDLLQQRGLDPGCFTALQSLCDVMQRINGILHQQSRQIALRNNHLPVLSQMDPSRKLPPGEARSTWHKRWSRAVDAAATGHRNLLVLSLWSIFPRNGPVDIRYSDLLPVLQIANACAFPAAPSNERWMRRRTTSLGWPQKPALPPRAPSARP